MGTVAPRPLTRLKDLGAGFCIMTFPLMLLFGFVSHPNILSFAVVTDYALWAAEWRGSFLFHFGHLLVMLAVPLIIVACIRLMSMLVFERGGWLWMTWGFVTLPIGFGVLAIGLMRQAAVPKWQGICMTAGLCLLMNPNIEIISSVGALLMCMGFIPLGARIALSRP